MVKEKKSFVCAVLMAVHSKDCAAWFAQAIESVFAQKSDDIEVRLYLVVDGPIDHELQQVIDKSMPRIYRIEFQPESFGLSAALNVGIALLGDEDYVFRMDSDDIALPGRFAKQIKFMEQNPSVAVSGGSIVEFREGSDIGFVRTYPFKDFKAHICKGTILAHPAVVFRRGILLRYKYNESKKYRMNQDIELWFRMLESGDIRFGNLPDLLLLFRISDQSIKRRSRERATVELETYLRGIRAIHGLSIRMLFPVVRYISRMLPQAVIDKLYGSEVRRFVSGKVRQIQLTEISSVLN